jgi:hypothetical protein
MLQDQVMYLYSMVTGADQRPGRDAYERLAELVKWHEDLVGRLGTVPGGEK